MKEPTFLERLVMMLKTLAGILTWVVAYFATLIRGKAKESANKP